VGIAFDRMSVMVWDEMAASYDRVARKYERRFLDELERKPRDREILTAFAASTENPIVDIGCGPGHVGEFVRERGRTVLGIDLSVEMVALAAVRLDCVVAADMRSLPLASDRIGGLLAFYSLIHIRRTELDAVLHEFKRVLRPGGRLLFSAHEGDGEITRDEFLDEPVGFVATLFQLGELVDRTEDAGLAVTMTERRSHYEGESETVRLYVEATKPTRRSR